MASELPHLLAELDAWAAAADWPVRTLAYGPGADHVGDLRLPRGGGTPTRRGHCFLRCSA